MILCIGEILADLIGEYDNGIMKYSRFPGGAPLNVAVGIQKLGGNVGFVGSVGNDIIGRFLFEFTSSVGFDYLDLNLDNTHNTTLAFVDVDEDGERHFQFSRYNTADYLIDRDRLDIISDFEIIHVGSLMLREEQGRALARDIMDTAHKYNKYVSFDVNYRDDIFSDNEFGISVYKEFIERADIIKLSEDEVELFTGSKDYKEGLSSLVRDDQLVFVTLGKNGSYYRYKDDEMLVPTKSVKMVDATGAGDAFYACVLKYLDDLHRYDKDRMEDILRHANICGGLACTKKGAISALPRKEILDVEYEDRYK